MGDGVTPILAAALLLVLSSVVGMAPVVRLIRLYEASHELKRGSAGWIRTIAGWSWIAFWLMSVWFLGTIFGDWNTTGDLTGAIDRGWLRLRILLEIAAALADSD